VNCTAKNKNIPFATPHVTDDEINSVVEVVKSGWWTTGPKVTEFEQAVCSYLTQDSDKELYAVALNSCTAGLFLALKVIGIKPGDEVIVPTWTFAATAQVVEWLGADPVICDVSKETLNIDIPKLEKLITSRTKAVIPVHMASQSADMDALLSLGEEKGIFILEDAAHALGADYNGKKVGSFGHAAVFSFYVTKNLACGEGGMLVTPEKEFADKVRKLSYFGINKQAHLNHEEKDSWYYEIDEVGYKFNMDSIHAAIGLVQLEKLDRLNQRRREIAGIYGKGLRNVKFYPKTDAPGHTWHLFIVGLPENVERDKVFKEMKEAGIGCSVHYIPLHLHPQYKNKVKPTDFPAASAEYKRVLSLPMHPSLTDEDVNHVIDTFNMIVERRP